MVNRNVDLVMVLSDMHGGGAQRVASLLANYWQGMGKKIAILTFSAVESDVYALNPEIIRRSLGGIGESVGFVSKITANLLRIRALRQAILETHAPVVISFVGPTNVLTVLATIGLDVLTIISERNDPARQSFGRMWDLLRWCIYRWADKVTANSLGAVDTLGAYVPARKLFFVPNPISPSACICSNNLESDLLSKGPAFLAVGRLHPQKAHDLLFRAFSIVHRVRPNWKLWIAGSGSLEGKLRALSVELGVAGNIEWFGYVADPFPLYRAANVFVMPSLHEGSPNALIEAMHMGLAPIVSDCSSGPLDLVIPDETGLVVPCGDVESLARAMATLANGVEMRERLGANARSLTQRYHIEKVICNWNSVIGW